MRKILTIHRDVTSLRNARRCANALSGRARSFLAYLTGYVLRRGARWRTRVHVQMFAVPRIQPLRHGDGHGKQALTPSRACRVRIIVLLRHLQMKRPDPRAAREEIAFTRTLTHVEREDRKKIPDIFKELYAGE